MGNPYLPQLGPGIGGALPGLPRRKDAAPSVPITAWEDIPYMEVVGVFDVSSESVAFKSFDISGDGLHFYAYTVAGTVFEYALSIAFDITSASFTTRSKDLTVGTDADLEGFAISQDGEHIYVVGDTSTEKIYQWDLSTPFDVSTASLPGKTVNINSQTTSPRALEISFDGEHAFVVNANLATLLQYDLSTPFDISTASFNQSKGFDSIFGNLRECRFNKEGTFAVWMVGADAVLSAFDLATPSDVSTMTVSPKALKPDYLVDPAVALSFDTKHVYLFNDTADEITQYGIS